MMWRVLEALDPYGQRREDIRYALLAKNIMDAQGVKKLIDQKPFEVADFLQLLDFSPTLEEMEEKVEASEPKGQSVEMMTELISAWVLANNLLYEQVH